MHPAFSVIFFTTLIGVAQGLFIALSMSKVYELANQELGLGQAFYSVGGVFVLALLASGLVASFFHLGHPERAWRSATQWRTSWLSREVIVLPVFMLVVFLFTVIHFFGGSSNSQLAMSLLGVILCFTLFICTGMIYSCLTFLREWATPLTVVNFTLLGCASGFSFATFYAALMASELIGLLGGVAIMLTLIAFFTRGWALIRNQNLKPKSTLQSAIGSHHSHIKQVSQGQMGGSYNTREFFHGKPLSFIRNIKRIFLIAVFPVPIILLWIGMATDTGVVLFFAFVIQYVGLLMERWFFFAQANHPQNLYYQTIS